MPEPGRHEVLAFISIFRIHTKLKKKRRIVMKRTRSSNGHENSGGMRHSVNNDRLRETQKLHARSTRNGRERAYQNEEFDTRFEQDHPDFMDDEGARYRSLERENGMSDGLNFARALENQQRHRAESMEEWAEEEEETTGRRGSEADQEDVRAELDIRGGKKVSRRSRGNETMDEQERWRRNDRIGTAADRIGTAAQRGRGSATDDGSWGQGRRRMNDRSYHN
jgi:hypothetical protein